MEYLDNAGNVFAIDVYSPTEPKNEKCQECHILLSVPGSMYCDVCQSMSDALGQTGYFFKAHLAWEEENQSRANLKHRIMGE
jgi:hypothetical protein